MLTEDKCSIPMILSSFIFCKSPFHPEWNPLLQFSPGWVLFSSTHIMWHKAGPEDQRVSRKVLCQQGFHLNLRCSCLYAGVMAGRSWSWEARPVLELGLLWLKTKARNSTCKTLGRCAKETVFLETG